MSMGTHKDAYNVYVYEYGQCSEFCQLLALCFGDVVGFVNIEKKYNMGWYTKGKVMGVGMEEIVKIYKKKCNVILSGCDNRYSQFYLSDRCGLYDKQLRKRVSNDVLSVNLQFVVYFFILFIIFAS